MSGFEATGESDWNGMVGGNNDFDRLKLPPEALSSPSAVDFKPDEHAAWYWPTWGRTLLLMNWRLVMFIPAIAALASIPVFFMVPSLIPFAIIYWKVASVVVALPLVLAVSSARNAIRLIKHPFCIHCGCDLTSQVDASPCPRCERCCTRQLMDDYRRDPRWFIDRHRLYYQAPLPDPPFHAGSGKSAKNPDGV